MPSLFVLTGDALIGECCDKGDRSVDEDDQNRCHPDRHVLGIDKPECRIDEPDNC